MTVVDEALHPEEPAWEGHFVVYVLNYATDDDRCWPHNAASGVEGSPSFTWGAGWALGNNDRGRYCSRSAQDKIKRFSRYTDAREAIQAQKRKRPKEDFRIVYVVQQAYYEVRTLEDAVAIEVRRQEAAQQEKERQAMLFPELDVLRSKYKPGEAYKLSGLLRKLREEGLNAVLASNDTAKSTVYGQIKKLKDAGITVDGQEREARHR